MDPKIPKCTGCGKEWESENSLIRHQNTCTEYAQRQKKITLSHGEYQREEAPRTARARDPSPTPAPPSPPPPAVSPPAPPTPPPQLRPSGRPNRPIRLPKRFLDAAPEPPPFLAAQGDAIWDAEDTVENDRPPSAASPAPDPLPNPQFTTDPDAYGVYRVYSHGLPSLSPDDHYKPDSVADTVAIAREIPRSESSWWSSLSSAGQQAKRVFQHFANPTVYHLMKWFYTTSGSKTHAQLDSLVQDVILRPDFQQSDLVGFRAAKAAKAMDTDQADEEDPELPFSENDGWIRTSITLSLPFEGFKSPSESQAPTFEVKDVFYRKLVPVIKAALREPCAELFHFVPFEEYWKPHPDEPVERLYGEGYTANQFNEEYRKLKNSQLPGDPELFLLNLIFASDSTLLTNFGTASLWPIYLYFANQSKYDRCHPSSFAAHHLKDELVDHYEATFGKPPSAAVLTFLRRELVQKIWELLLDEEFVEFYAHGILFEFWDEQTRRLFLRILCYLADYPEKVMLACIRFLATCPCPRCLCLKEDIHKVGIREDLEIRTSKARVDSVDLARTIEKCRRMIFKRGTSIISKKIEDKLKPMSLVPTRSAFSKALLTYGFNFYRLWTPDLLHEFELGIWRAVFIHLLRVLYAKGGNCLQKMNHRYRQVSSFGRGTIRKISNNPSGLKRLAARDFEDFLQVAIPVFEGLMGDEEEDEIVRIMLFELATWHGFAKMRLKTTTMVVDLRNSGIRLGRIIRRFKDELCTKYHLVDLPRDEAARGRQKPSLVRNYNRATASRTSGTERFLNMNTYKMHSAPDYPSSIMDYGTTDNTSAVNTEAEHRRPKRHNKATKKGDHQSGIAKNVQRERLVAIAGQLEALETLASTLEAGSASIPPVPSSKATPETTPEAVEPIPVDKTYVIGNKPSARLPLLRWHAAHKNDLACGPNFVRDLKDHLLMRLKGQEYDGDEYEVTSAERNRLQFYKGMMYEHRTLRVNYTTYDRRRDQDTLNPRTCRDVMLLSPETDENARHPYWYARIIGIYHVDVLWRDSKTPHIPMRMDFLHIRWFGRDASEVGGWGSKRLHRVGFVDHEDHNSPTFGFLDPALVIRGIHLIPGFHDGFSEAYLPPSPLARLPEEGDKDYIFHYVGMFSDRDLMMRFRGGAVGHQSTRGATNEFLDDRDAMDLASRAARRRGEDPLASYPPGGDFDDVDIEMARGDSDEEELDEDDDGNAEEVEGYDDEEAVDVEQDDWGHVPAAFYHDEQDLDVADEQDFEGPEEILAQFGFDSL